MPGFGDGFGASPVDSGTWTLPNGPGIIVGGSQRACGESVQAGGDGSIHEDRHGAGLAHPRAHAFKGTVTRGASEFAQRIQDAGGYQRHTPFDRTVWADIPSTGVPVAIELLTDVMNSRRPRGIRQEQEANLREFRWATTTWIASPPATLRIGAGASVSPPDHRPPDFFNGLSATTDGLL